MYFLYQKIPLTCLLHQPWWLDLPTPPPLPCDENFEGTKVAKQKHMFSKGGILFCMMHYILFRNAPFVWLHVCFVLQAAYLCFLSLLLLFFCAVIFYALFSHFSLSLFSLSSALSRRSRVRRHPPSSRSLSLRVRMGPSARSLYTRSLFCLLLNHVRPHSFQRPDSLKPPFQISW